MDGNVWLGSKSIYRVVLSLALTFLWLASCGEVFKAQAQSARTTSVPVGMLATPVPNAANTPASDDASSDAANLLSERAVLHKMSGPDGWAWRTSIPEHRLVAFYGNPLSPVMGPIGQYSDADLINKLHEQAQVYEALDPAHPVVPALDYVSPVVQPVSMDDGSWVYRMPGNSIEHYIDLANKNHALFFYDMQVGHSTVQKEVNLIWSDLQKPGVDLSLDPGIRHAAGCDP